MGDMIYGIRHAPSLIIMVLIAIFVVIIPHSTINSGSNGGNGMVMASTATCNCTCIAGEYTTDCSLGTCAQCTAGNRCPGGADISQIPCLQGTYSSAGASTCTSCPSGSSCSDPSIAPVACTAGHFSTGGAIVCTQCTGGYQTSSGQSSCTSCPAGSSCMDPAVAPVQCAAGSSSTFGSGICVNCAQGSYSAAGASTCTNCPSGYQCSDPSVSPVQCLAGTYAIAGSKSCTACSGGYQTSAGQSSCTSCPAGSQCTNAAISPVQCTAGQSSTLGAGTCTSCAQGSYSAAGAGTCTNCPSGYQCSDPTISPVQCLAGTYAIAGSKACTTCSPGYQTSAGQSTCTQCPAGYQCTNPAIAPVACAAGTSSTLGAGVCTSCAQGTYTVSGTCVTCPAGYSCSDATASPVICLAGTYATAGSIVCSSCALGTYANSTGWSTCLGCPPGFQCSAPSYGPIACNAGTVASGVNSTTCVACQPGTYSYAGQAGCTACTAGSACADPTIAPVACNDGSFAATGASICTSCTAGRYTSSGVGRVACSTCTAGSACAAGLPIVACTSGYYAAASASVCTQCPAGSSCTLLAATLCAAGRYSSAGATTCALCAAGTGCAGTGTTAPVTCSSGQYSILGGTAGCTACPAGSFCATPVGTFVTCPTGTYSGLSATACTTCPAGSSCTTTAATGCASGYYSNGGATSCTPCVAGFACPLPSSQPVVCAAGTYSLAQATSCIACPAGSRCATTSAVPIACFLGTYSTGNAVACTACPAGFACAATTQGATLQCQPGTYSVGSQSNCTTCAAGYYCPRTDAALIIQCPRGSYSLGGVAACTPCPAGSYCESAAIGPIVCPTGTWSIGDAVACQPCPAGYACTTSSDVFTPCTAGSFSPSGVATCTTCTAGNYCPVTTTATGGSTACPTGFYSSAGAVVCTACPAGFRCTSSSDGTTTACLSGQYRYAGMDLLTCATCALGYQCPTKDQPPQACLAGYYSSSTGATACLPCTAGSQCLNPLIAPTQCAVGTWSAAQSTYCPPCDAGYYCGLGSTSSRSIICPTGNYCPRGSSAGVNCPAGTLLNMTGGTSAGDCFICPPGYWCAAGSTQGTICPAGYWCPAGTKIGTDFACPAGTYQPLTGQVSSAACVQCPQGFTCVGGASVSTAACSPGYYCPPGTSISTQYPCSAGTYSTSTTLIDQTGCTPCPAGAYCLTAAILPTYCPTGTYRATTGATLAQNCIQCPEGTSCPNTGTITVPAATCQAGYYCPAGTSFSTDYPCPAGTYTDSTSLVSVNGCTTCPAGSACGFASTSAGINPIMACAAGHYCPAGTGTATAHPCAGGSYSASTSLVDQSGCTPCPAGSYCLGGESAISGPCAAGYYCPASTNTSRQFPCAAGTYSAATTLTQQGDCTPCPVGSFCPVGSSAPTKCYAGSFAPNTYTQAAGAIYGSNANTTFPYCDTCHEGNSCGEGASSLTACAAGTYSTYGSSSCSACPTGYYCPVAATGYNKMLSSYACPAGVWCSGSIAVVPTTTTNPCPVGQYCLSGATLPTNCPAGSYNAIGSGTSVSSCLDCPAGSYCAEGVSNTTGLCDPGFYCPLRSTGSQAVPCPGGTYRLTPGATIATDCGTCRAGYYCPRGNDTGVVCPLGYYCTDGAVSPTPCPLGTYGAATGLQSIGGCTGCDGGWYCDALGISLPTAKCDPGYYCTANATTSTPPNGATGGTCAAGGYCPQGTVSPLPCNPGTYQNVSGASSILDCIPCLPGFYCQSTSSPAPTGYCFSGYYCTGGASDPRQFSTPPGYYSYEGSSLPTPCEAGSYTPGANYSACLLCPAGFYCANQSTIFYTDCPHGSYCIQGSHTPTRCPVGTYGNVLGMRNVTDCISCDAGQYCSTNGMTAPDGNCTAGYYCTLGAQTPRPTLVSWGGQCPAGSYCIAGTAVPTPCPLGTYRDSPLGTTVLSCLSCPAGYHCNATGLTGVSGQCAPGYYCTGGAQSSTPTDGGITGGVCQPSYYCPAGTIVPLSCAAGTYANSSGMPLCLTCPAGYYCTANSSHPIICPAGSYCPINTGDVLGKCGIGTFGNTTGLAAATDCYTCSPGSYCLTPGLTSPTGVCNAGWYCPSGAIDPYGATVASSTPKVCTSGSYCVVGSAHPTPCAAGYYLPSTGADEATDCIWCDIGSYCASSGLPGVSGACAAGYYCTGGTITSAPNASASATPTRGDVCPTGYYCIAGSFEPHGCPAGKYQDQRGQSSCVDCPAGYYCTANSTTYTATPCVHGYYCPNKTEYYNQFPCGVGTYNNLPGQDSAADCIACTAGSYCDTEGLFAPTAQCSGGYYCTLGAITPTPVTVAQGGGQCPLGYYCPLGNSHPIACDGGKYCDQVGLSTWTNDCSAGYYCIGLATSATPTDGITGAKCPAGYWCGTGVDHPTACGLSTYAPTDGNVNSTACIPCQAGWYCNSTGIAAVSTVCPAKYYCPTGTSVPSLLCTAGNYCPAQSITPTPCDAGTWQQLTGQVSCVACPAGYYCEGTGRNYTTICPSGSYCPGSTLFATEYVCPIGTFNNRTQLTNVTQCSSCLPGYYCSRTGLSWPDGLCSAGYYCTSGATSPTPNDPVNGNVICPAGRYCPAGSAGPTTCVAGTYAPGAGNTNITACLACPRGQYCATAGAVAAGNATSYCNAGFICFGGATTPTPSDGITGRPCAAGYYCGVGALIEVACSPTTFNNITGQSQCSTCLAGGYCPFYGMTYPTDCPAGFWCGSGVSLPSSCIAGTYSYQTKLKAASQCTTCDIGSYCSGSNSTRVTGSCSAGYFCAGGSVSPSPSGTYPASGPCPAGRYCLVGSLGPTLCNSGTYNPFIGSDEALDCLTCPPGQYCSGLGLIAPTGNCTAGYYCTGGSTTATQNQCTVSSYCVAGSSWPVSCPAATYQDEVSQSTCKTCPEARYCPFATTTPINCTLGNYCAGGNAYPTACPAGQYGTISPISDPDLCAACPAGSYCNGGKIQGICAAGYLCLVGNSVPNPIPPHANNLTIGGPCPAGYYCLAGATSPTSCADGTIRDADGASNSNQCLACPAGYTCLAGNPVPVPCAAGNYCPSSGITIPCDIATYSKSLAAINISTCIACPAGYWCNETGLADYIMFPCPAGFWCGVSTLEPSPCNPGTYRPEAGAASPSDCDACPAGTYCPSGSNDLIGCPEGQFCPAGSIEPSACPGGYYCPSQTLYAISCPAGAFCAWNSSIPTNCSYCPPNYQSLVECSFGLYCPARSLAPLYCQPGYKSQLNAIRTSLADSCTLCSAGTWQSNPALTVCESCTSGYTCAAGAITGEETPCPVGYYCPAGSATATPCSPGYFNMLTGSNSSTECLKCSDSTNGVSNTYASSKCTTCSSSSEPNLASTECVCKGANRAYQSSTKKCVCIPDYEFILDGNTLNEDDSTIDCQPVVYPRCSSGKALSATGTCVSTSGANCNVQCASQGGTGRYVVSLGMCDCSAVVTLDAICNRNCRKQAPTLSMDLYGKLSVTNNVNGNLSYSLDLADMETVLIANTSSDVCAGGCELYPMVVTGGVGGLYASPPVLGSYEPTASVQWAVMGQPSISTWNTAGDRRILASTATSVVVPAAMCLQIGQGLLFDLTQSASYPVYLRENLLNSNLNFDYGPFQELATKLSANSSALSMFAFTFDTAGTYVLADSSSTANPTVIRVVAASDQCPFDDPIQPLTEQSLVQLGVTTRTDLVLALDWNLLAVIIALVVFLVVVLILAARHFKFYAWGIGKVSPARYKAVALQPSLDVFAKFETKGTFAKVAGMSGGAIDVEDVFDPATAAKGGKSTRRGKGVSHATNGDKSDKAVAKRDDDATASSEKKDNDNHEKKEGDHDEAKMEADKKDTTAKDADDAAAEAADTERLGGKAAVYMAQMKKKDKEAAKKDDPAKPKRQLSEYQSSFDFESLDFTQLYSVMNETKGIVEGYVRNQQSSLGSFFERMSIETEQLKAVLAIKLQVQLNKSGEGYFEAVTRLVGGELDSRLCHRRLFEQQERVLMRALRILDVKIRTLKDDYNVSPMLEQMRHVVLEIDTLRKAIDTERARRKGFGAHAPIVGDAIIDQFKKIDTDEVNVMNQWLQLVSELMVRMSSINEQFVAEEEKHGAELERMADLATEAARRDENLRYHAKLIDLTKSVQAREHEFAEALRGNSTTTGVNQLTREMNKRMMRGLVWVRDRLIDRRIKELRQLESSAGRVFRGINPELAKILTGLIGMQGGLYLDEKTGHVRARHEFDPNDPFATIEDRPIEVPADTSVNEEELKKKWQDEEKKKHDADEDEKHRVEDKEKETKRREDERREMEDKLRALGVDQSTRGEIRDAKLRQAEAKEAKLREIRDRIDAVTRDPTLSDEARRHRLEQLQQEYDFYDKVWGGEHDSVIVRFLAGMTQQKDEVSLELEDMRRLAEELDQIRREKEDALAQLEQAQADAKVDDEKKARDAEKDKERELSRAVRRIFELPMSDSGVRPTPSGASADGVDGNIIAGAVPGDGKWELEIQRLRDSGKTEEQVRDAVLKAAQEQERALRREQEARVSQRAALHAALQKREADMKAKLDRKRAELEVKSSVALAVSDVQAAAKNDTKELPSASSTPSNSDATAGHDAERRERDEHRRREAEEKRLILFDELEQNARDAVDNAFDTARAALADQRAVVDVRSREEQIADLKRREAEAKASGDTKKAAELARILESHYTDVERMKHEQDLEHKRQADTLAEKRDAMKRARQAAAEAKRRAGETKESKEDILARFIEQVKAALAKLKEESRRASCRRVIEMIMEGHWNKQKFAQHQELEELRQKQLSDLFASMTEGQSIRDMSKEVEEQITSQRAKLAAGLAKQQHEELKNVYRAVYPDETFTGPEWQFDELSAANSYLQSEKEALEQEEKKEKARKEKELAEIQERKLRADEEFRKKIDAANTEESAAEQERHRMEREREEKKRGVELERKKRELEARQGMSAEEKARVLKEHEDNVANMNLAQDNERLRQQNNLRVKLEAKKARDAAATAARRKAGGGATPGHQRHGSMAATQGFVPAGGAGAAAGGAAGALAGGARSDDDEKRIAAMEEKERKDDRDRRDVIGKMESIEQLMIALRDGAEGYRKAAFIDPRDEKDPRYQSDPKAKLQVVNMRDLDARSFVMYRFADQLINALFASGVISSPSTSSASPDQPAPVQLLLAKSLPRNPYPTAYRNSFFYSKEKNTLVIRKTRLEDVGEFIVVLLHCLAHISTSASSDEWDDRNPAFVACFLKCIRVVAADMYYARSVRALSLTAPSSSANGGHHGDNDDDEVDMGPSPSLANMSAKAKQAAVDELVALYPLGVHTPGNTRTEEKRDGGSTAVSSSAKSAVRAATNNDHFSRTALAARLDQYTTFQRSAALRDHLADMERMQSAREVVREQKEAKTFRSRSGRETENKDDYVNIVRTSEHIDTDVLASLGDQLTDQLVTAVARLFDAQSEAERLSKMREERGHHAVDLDEQIERKKAMVRDLTLHKDTLSMRLANLHDANDGKA